VSTRDYAAIGAWCTDAHAVVAADLPAQVATLVADTIQRFSGKAPILDVARDLAEGLSHLPAQRREAANALLKAKHGFGYEYFTGRAQSRLVQIVARGLVRTEKEHRMALDALSDTTLDPELVAALQRLVLERERQLGAT
jgi:hypothetical protein